LIVENPDIFPGFFRVDIEDNVLPKLELLRQFGFYPQADACEESNTDSCGAHSPRVALQEYDVGHDRFREQIQLN
jgi:hypothetical protein